jgi:hypothetical protein
LFARHVLSLGDESSLRAMVNGTARLGQGVRREAESEGSRRQNLDSTNRNRIPGRSRWVTRHWTRMPDIHSEAWQGRSGEARGKDSTTSPGKSVALRRRSSLSAWQHVETERQKSAEAVVAVGWACREGLPGASRRRLAGRGAAARRVLPTIPVRGLGGEPAPRPGWRSPQLICAARGATSVRGV